MKKIFLLLASFVLLISFAPSKLKADDLNKLSINLAKFDKNKIEIRLDSNEKNLNLQLDYKIDDGKWLSEDFDNLISLTYNEKTSMYEYTFKEEIKFTKNLDVRVRAILNEDKSNFSNVITFKSTLNAKNYDYWAKDAIHKADTLGIVVESMREDMKKQATRLEFVESLVKALEYKKTVKDYANEVVLDTDSPLVKKAYKLNLLVYNEKKLFYPNRLITREEVAAILDRLSAHINFEDKIENKLIYDDASEWAKNSIGSVVKKGLMIGDNNLKFNPKNNIKREEVLVSVLRIID